MVSVNLETNQFKSLQKVYKGLLFLWEFIFLDTKKY